MNVKLINCVSDPNGGKDGFVLHSSSAGLPEIGDIELLVAAFHGESLAVLYMREVEENPR